MARTCCYRCNRPQAACLCDLAVSLDNSVNVYVLQHREETAHPRGTAIIAQLCLQNYRCWRGEDFTTHTALLDLVDRCANSTLVVYPTDHARVVNLDQPDGHDLESVHGIGNLIFIDASWRKAKKIWYSTPVLHTLPCVSLAGRQPSRYRIRKEPGANYLSTVECIARMLSWVESRPGYYRPMLDVFDTMIQRQIDQMGRATYEKNYLNRHADETYET